MSFIRLRKLHSKPTTSGKAGQQAPGRNRALTLIHD